MTFSLAIDFPILMTAIMASVLCACVGNFLVVRREAMMGEAMAHVALPGIIAGVLIAGSASILAMTAGALIAMLAAGILIALIRHYGKVEQGAAMGAVFTVFFAGGIALMEMNHAANNQVLSMDNALFGNLEGVLWLDLERWSDLTNPTILVTMPRQMLFLFLALFIVSVLLRLFFKEFLLSSFDPLFAQVNGYQKWLTEGGLIVLVALAAVASFEAVGSILILAMFAAPAATARLLTTRFTEQLWLSLNFAVLSAVFGFFCGAYLPLWLGLEHSLSIAGMIAVISVLMFLAVVAFKSRREPILV